MASVTADDFRWLISEDASPYLVRARSESSQLVRLTRALRQELSAEQTHLVLEQAALRERAREKFQRAEEMFFTATLLEQATEERIARYKGTRFADDLPIVDLCCGLGGDSLGLGQRAAVRAIDRNSIAVLLAAANAAVYDVPKFSSRVADVEQVLEKIAGPWHIDPDRRAAGHRTTQVEYFEPAVEVLQRLRLRHPDGCVKLASITAIPEIWQEAEREWIGSRRECRQQVAWFGQLAHNPGQHRATVVEANGQATSITGRPDERIQIAKSLGRYIFEPHAAVLAAQLAANLAQELDLTWLAPRIAYWTGDRSITTPLLGSFEVVEVLPFDLRQLRAALSARRIGRLEIKARGVDIDPISLRKQLRPRGDEELTLLIAGPPSRVQAILAKRLSL